MFIHHHAFGYHKMSSFCQRGGLEAEKLQFQLQIQILNPPFFWDTLYNTHPRHQHHPRQPHNPTHKVIPTPTIPSVNFQTTLSHLRSGISAEKTVAKTWVWSNYYNALYNMQWIFSKFTFPLKIGQKVTRSNSRFNFSKWKFNIIVDGYKKN